MKGSGVIEELNLSQNATKILNLSLVKNDTYELPKDKGTRNILVFKKTKKTHEQYPRLYSKIKKQPL